mmetsp:Transcript_9688/g.13346  ORF Transcript_9688/g.13346 Transcript_9688/m.13346 type:complete len:243 (+) Transcript_9688:62-790(+)
MRRTRSQASREVESESTTSELSHHQLRREERARRRMARKRNSAVNMKENVLPTKKKALRRSRRGKVLETEPSRSMNMGSQRFGTAEKVQTKHRISKEAVEICATSSTKEPNETPSKVEDADGSFMFSPIPIAHEHSRGQNLSPPAEEKVILTAQEDGKQNDMTAEIEKSRSQQIELCDEDPYEDDDKRDSGRFKPMKRVNKDKISPKTLKRVDDQAKKTFEDAKAFFEELDGEDTEDLIEFV